jgi:ABC-type multidrug transport system ATPase subunit
MLTGKMSPSSGDAYIMGHSVIHNVESIQELVGSVPQHDLLWSELSAYEHVRLFATIKGIISSSEDITREVAIARILRKVHLEKEANQAAGGYSGGMKRRLSIALAGVGSPAILFMDEPTTGIDPLNRRRIWKLIQELKKGKVIVLTTHLMQEADSLGDYVAILDHGKIQAEGTPLNLKTEYGSGYSLNLITDVDKVDRVCELAKEAIPGVQLVNSSAGSVAIGIPKNGLEKVPQLTRDLQDEELIREWSVSQSTLEEVFLRLVKHDTALQVTEPSSSSPSNLVEGEQIPAEPDNLNDAINLAVEEGQMEPTFATKHAWILQIRSLLWKTFLLQRRSIVGSLVLFVIPILSLVLLNVKLFKPLKPPTSIYDGYIILYPQAMALIGFPQSPPCDFFWYVSSSLDGTLDSVNYHTTPLGVVGAFEARQAPPGAIDDRDNEYYVTLEWSMSISSNVTLAEVESALQFAFREELKRANSPATQSLADARCNGEHCGPCRVDTSSLNVVTRDDNMFLFSLPGIYSSNSLPACQSTVGECPLNAVRFAMLQGSFMSTLSQQLNSPASLVATPSYTYRDSFESVEKVVTLESTSLGENSGSSFFDDNLGTGYCSSCDDKKPISVWISGDGAASFAELYIGEDTEIIVKNTDVLELVLTGRKHLETQSQVFGTTTFSSCAVLKNRGNYYENVWDERGWIVNMDAPTPITNFSANCDSVEEQRDAYKLLFPDAGFQVMSFDLVGDKVVVDITSLVYDASGGYGLEVYNIKDQAVFSVHCEASDLNGTCLPDSNLICAMTTPPIAAGCSLPQYRTAGSALVESTYNAIIGSVIPGGTLKVNTQPTTSTTLITYVPALKTDDLALIAALFALFIAMLMPLISSIIVAEKHQRYVFAMLLNGLSLVNYWVATYIFHAVMCWIVVLFATTLALAMGLPPFEGLSYGHFFFVIITYIHAQFGFTALLSICFSKERFASILLSLGSVVLFGIAWVMLAAVQPILNHWSGLFSLIPMLGASRAFFLLFWNQHLPEVTTICGIFLGSGTLYLMIAIYAHGATGVGALWKPHCSCKHQNAEGNTSEEKASTDGDDEMEGHDLDVRREALRALGLSPSEVAIKVAHLGKTFPARPLPKNAVVDVSMAMDYGEIFGLLGPNGAGKYLIGSCCTLFAFVRYC